MRHVGLSIEVLQDDLEAVIVSRSYLVEFFQTQP